MIKGTSCSQIFSQKSAWQEEAFNELKNSLTATRENRFIRYQDEKEAYLVMIWGKSQIGKSTLILKLIGVRDENFKEVYDTLRAGSQQGNSSTVTAIIYAMSDTEQYALSFARLDELAREKKYYDAQGMMEALQQVRQDVENGEHTSAEKILFIDIPKHFFAENAAVGSIRIMDMPGVESRNEKEWDHIRNLMDSYLPISQVCIIACNAADIQSLGATELPRKIPWRGRPERFMVVSTASYSQANVQDYFRTERPARKEDFRTFIHDIYDRTFKAVIGEETKLELYPIDLGDSLVNMLGNLDSEDAAEVQELLEKTLHELRMSISKREGRRFQAAIEDLRSRVDSYAKDDLASIEQQIRKAEDEIIRQEERIKGAEKQCKELETDEEVGVGALQHRYHVLEDAKSRLQQKMEEFALVTGWRICYEVNEEIDRENLYREKSSGKFLKDKSCSKMENPTDKKALSAALKTLESELESCWSDVAEIYQETDLNQPVKSRFPKNEIILNARTTYYNLYYSKGFFAKVYCSDLEKFNYQMAEEAGSTLEKKFFEDLYRELDEEMHSVEYQRSEKIRIIEKKSKSRKEAEWEKQKAETNKKGLQQEKEHIEAIQKADQEQIMRYLDIAQRHYSKQRSEILNRIRDSTSAEEKTKWVLMLALTDRDYENLRRAGNGSKTGND